MTWQCLEIWVCVISNELDIDWDINRNWENTLHWVFYFVHTICWMFPFQILTFPLTAVPSCFIFIPRQMRCCNLRASHFWQNLCPLLKSTQKSHWFKDQKDCDFSQPPPTLTEYLFNVFLDKMLPQAINHSTPPPFISLQQITRLLSKWTASPSGQTETWLIYFSSHTVFLKIWSASSVRFWAIINLFQHIFYIQVYIVAFSCRVSGHDKWF